MMKQRIILFLTAFFQVGLVAVNIYQVAHQLYFGAFMVGLCISILWTFNVKGVAFGGWTDRFVYAFGAAFGTVIGIYLSTLFYNI